MAVHRVAAAGAARRASHGGCLQASFEEGEYSATDLDSPPLLTINAPIGLNLRDEPAEITNRSVVQNNAEETIGLEVSPGNNLTLVGGEINLEGGNLTATGGRIELGGLSQAGTVTFNGDGSLSIDAKFIVAFANGSNDIIANAEQGQGGNISINAESILGIQERLLSETTNDINASSEVSGLDGTVNIILGATKLPSNNNNLVVPEQTMEQACQSDREAAAQNGLNIKGKGGVPPAPELPLNSQNIIIEGEYTEEISATPQPIETSKGFIQPARGIKKTEEGIILTAYRTDNQGDRLPEIKPNCGI